MKKLLLTALLAAFLAVPAFAGDTGFYAGAKIMDSIQSTGKVSTSGSAGFFDTGSYTQNTIGGGIFAGYDFYKQGGSPIRAEIEYALRSTVNKEYSGKRAMTVGGMSGSASLKSQYNMHTIFANVYYDFHNDSAFTPFVGGGLGLAIINHKVEGEASIGPVSGSDSYNTTETALAYNLGLGCSYDLTDAITADLAYRFVGTSYHETDKSINGTKVNLGMANYANEISLGLRYNF